MKVGSMKTFSKIKSLPIEITLMTVILLVIYSGFGDTRVLPFILLWVFCLVLILVFYYSTYRIDVLDREVILHPLLRRKRSVNLEEITLVRFEGIILRSKWIIMNFYNENELIDFVDVHSINRKDFIRSMIRNASLNGYKVEFDDAAKKLISELEE